jgi:hypothetical protein
MDIRSAAISDIPSLLSLVERYREFEGIGGFDQQQVQP